MRSTLSLFLGTLLATSVPAAAQDGLPVRGHLSPTGDGILLEPCGLVQPYAVSTSGMVGNQLSVTLAGLGITSSGRAFVAMDGWMDTGPIDEASSGLAGTWAPTRIDSIRPETSADCSGEAPPIWAGSGCDRYVGFDLDCLPSELVQADLQLARYLTEALRFARDPEDLVAAHAKWKQVRELRCSPSRPGGRVDAVWVLGCRVGQSRGRTQLLWDQYLRGQETSLRDPRLGA